MNGERGEDPLRPGETQTCEGGRLVACLVWRRAEGREEGEVAAAGGGGSLGGLDGGGGLLADVGDVGAGAGGLDAAVAARGTGPNKKKEQYYTFLGVSSIKIVGLKIF